MTGEFAQTFTQGAPGEQIPSAFEGKPEEALRGFVENHWEPLAWSTSYTYSKPGYRPEVEIKAEP